MNQPNPEEQGMGPMQHQDPSSMMNEQPMQQSPLVPDPMETLPLVLLSYMEHVEEIKGNPTLDEVVRATILSQMAQSINYLVPLLPKADPSREMDMQMKVAEFEMNEQSRQAEMQMKREMHQMDMQMRQDELQFKEAESKLKLQQQQEQHQQKLVQSKEQGELKAQQVKQAAQLKPTSKPSK